MSCPICNQSMRHAFHAKVLSKYSSEYEVCSACGFLRAAEPYWLSEAYTSAIAVADTGLVMRNLSIAGKLSAVLYWIFNERGEGQYLDAAGGYGMLTRLMRDYGFNFYWKDRYCSNLITPGFEYSEELGACKAVSAIEVMEHLTDPVSFVNEILSLAGSETLIFTTELYEGEPPNPQSWWYYAFETGQHIGFYKRKTLETLGNRLGLNFYSAGGIHILTKTTISNSRMSLFSNKLVGFLSPLWIKSRLGSKTISDHEAMMSNIR